MDIKEQIGRGLRLRAEIEAAKAELKAIEAAVVAVARHAEHHDLVDAEREGKQAMLDGGHCLLPVIFESDMITGTMPQGGPLHLGLKLKYKEEALAPFYKAKNTLEMQPKDGKAFRALAREAFAPELAAAFVHDCLARDKTGIPKSRIVVAWENVKQKAGLCCVAPLAMLAANAPEPGWKIPDGVGMGIVCFSMLGLGIVLGMLILAAMVSSADRESASRADGKEGIEP